MKLTCAFLLLFAANSVFCAPDYYWRDYKGIVPQDAILGGRDKYNQPTFIGQALIKEGGIMPCTIYNGNKTVDVEYYGHLKTDTHVKILCTRKPKNMYWLSVTTDNINAQVDHHMVIGGFEFLSDCSLRIGRVNFKNEVVVGKIVCTLAQSRMYFATKDEISSADSYQVLAWRDSPL